jgi:thiol-disulfide isomerase/thioredoxin
MAGGMSVDEWKTHKFRRIPPKINKKNVRYKITCPDQGIFSNINREWEFDRKTFYLIQAELSVICAETFPMGNKIDILEQRLYDCIHPDILDTISFTFEKIKKEYDRQCAEKQAQRDSLFRAALSYSKAQLFKDTQFPFMPEWKFPLLSGDTLYSDSINSRFLLMDMWFINCPPCMKAMRELSSIDTLYEESLLKMVSINAFDKDTAQISKVVKNLSLQCDIACAYDEKKVNEMSKKMGK